MDGAMQGAKPDKNPSGIDIRGIDLICDEEIERERIEQHRHLEEVFQIVRRIGHKGWRELRERTGHREIIWTEFVTGDEMDAPGVHVDPDDKRQHYGREKGTENCVLCHGVAI